MSAYDQNQNVISCVKCNVENCIHNQQGCRCTASSIKIGPHSACSCQETVCQSFCAK